ncbi:MAG: glycosyltransferase family 4 protein [Chloracidobacterium sp.]|nr:glycosyltransferase family 4 protein [Chloracidobacterium sp.]
MEAISELFAKTTVVVPCENAILQSGGTPLIGRNLEVVRLAVPSGAGLRRKLAMSFWIITNGKVIWRQIKNADAVHTPIPGDVGTIGMLFALMMRKPIFVRHCGNWFVQRTIAEKFWKWSMEFFGGGRNVMFATGGSSQPPSQSNPSLKWIFSTSLRRGQIAGREPLTLPADGRIRLAIACRQEARKGTDIVIDSMPNILRTFPNASLDVIGDGSLLATLKQRVQELGLKDKVNFHGKLEHAKVISLLKQNHIFCYPTSASEGFPKVVLEALASGMPVITTRVSVLPDLISSGCGVLLDSPSPASLSNAVIEVCSDQAKYKVMSSKAMSTAQKYSLEDWRDFIGKTLREAWNVSTLS